jgi:hypothetical protein
VSAAAVESFGILVTKDENATTEILALIADRTGAVKAAAVNAFAQLSHKNDSIATNQLRQCLDDDDALVVIATLRSLGCLFRHAPRARSEIIDLISKRLAAGREVQCPSPSRHQELRTPEWRIQEAAAEALHVILGEVTLLMRCSGPSWCWEGSSGGCQHTRTRAIPSRRGG